MLTENNNTTQTRATNTMKKLIITALLFASFSSSYAQQDPHYTQYMYNMNIINPAYAGSKETLSGGLLFRRQWVGLEGAPSTGTFNIHTPLGKNVGGGLSFVSDRIGPAREQNLYADFSYTLNLGGEHRLALGLKAGATFHQIGLFDEVFNTLPDLNDPLFANNVSRAHLNAGLGAFYYTDRYYVAFSMPNMFRAVHLNTDDGKRFGSETLHFFLTGGYVFDLNPDLKFKPFAMIKSAVDVPVSWDLSTNFLFNERFEVGATYRFEDSFGAMVGFQVNPNLKIGYAYDHITSVLRNTTPNSHELILLFDLDFPKRVSRSSRFF